MQEAECYWCTGRIATTQEAAKVVQYKQEMKEKWEGVEAS